MGRHQHVQMKHPILRQQCATTRDPEPLIEDGHTKLIPFEDAFLLSAIFEVTILKKASEQGRSTSLEDKRNTHGIEG